MSAHLDNTLVWIAFDNRHVLMIFTVIDMVQLSSVWLSQQRTFFFLLGVSTCHRLWSIFVVCMEVHGHIAVLSEHVLTRIRPIFSYLRSGFVLLHTSKWWLVSQTFGKEINPEFESIEILSYVEVTAVILFDTVHQALITHTGGYIVLIQHCCTLLTWRL